MNWIFFCIKLGMISAFKIGYLPWHAINKLRFCSIHFACNNESRAFKISFQFLSYIIFYHNILFINLLISPSYLQLYELSDDSKRKDFLDDLFAFMQKRGKSKYKYSKAVFRPWYEFCIYFVFIRLWNMYSLKFDVIFYLFK